MALTDSPIALAARDELPETWDKLVESTTFGQAAMERRLTTLMHRAFGEVMDETEQESLDPVLVSYMGKRLALEIIIPGIDYWSKQALSLSAGERESKAFKDRAEDLKELRKLLLEDSSQLLAEVEGSLPRIPRRATDRMRVQEAGLLVEHVTSDPMLFPPIYGPPETTP